VGGMLIQEHQAAVGLEDHVQFCNHSINCSGTLSKGCGVLVTLLSARDHRREEGVSGGAAAALRVGDKERMQTGSPVYWLRESFWRTDAKLGSALLDKEALPRFEAVEEVRFSRPRS